MVEIFINLCEEVLAYILLKNVTLPAPLKKSLLIKSQVFFEENFKKPI